MQFCSPKLIAYLSIITFGFISPSLNADCGRTTIAEMNWPSAQLTAYIDKHFLAEAFNCDVRLVAGDTMPTITSMIETEDPSVAPEVWVYSSESRTANVVPSSNSLVQLLNTAKNQGRVTNTGRIYVDNIQDGFWVPARMLSKNPELASIRGILDHPELFPHPDKPNRSAFYGCPTDWRCHATTSQFFQLYDLFSYGFDLVTPKSGADLAASMSKTYDKDTGWFGYYWQPTAPVGKYDLVKVRLLDKGQEFEFTYHVETYVSATLTNQQLVMNYFRNRHYPNEVMSELLSWKEEMGATTTDTVEHFLQNYEYLWTEWVEPYTASVIKSSLK